MQADADPMSIGNKKNPWQMDEDSLQCGLRASRLQPSLPSQPTPTPPFLCLTTAELATSSLLQMLARHRLTIEFCI